MSVKISGVEPGSPAEQMGILPGDLLLRLDGHDIEDVLDYRFYMTASRLTVEGQTGSGQPFVKQVKKGQYDDLGLEFDTYLMDKQRTCKNKCVFCFIDQMPGGLRETLYVKDDDSRMSFLFGNYITLTNLRERDVERIIKMHISPVNVSVHTTNPELRVRMMGNPRSGEVLGYLPRLAGAGIRINAQLVLCPDLNDGTELRRSLRDLCDLAPALQSIAVVPVGLTAHRESLPKLRLFQKTEAAAVIQEIEEMGAQMLEQHGERICYPADEFFLAAGVPIPQAAYYGDFAQLENGVGLLSLLRDEFQSALEGEEAGPVRRRVTVATGKAAAPMLRQLAELAQQKRPGLAVTVIPIENRFFGSTITVAGLVTGQDLITQLKDRDLGEALIIPAAMLRHERDLFLDSVSLEEAQAALGVPVTAVENDGYTLLEALLGR